MSEHPNQFPVSERAKKDALLSEKMHAAMYKESVENPEAFWRKQADALNWFTPYETVKNTSFDNDVSIRWFEGGKLNVSHNCLDRHLETRGEQTAIIWESDDGNETRHISYKQLHHEVCKLANVYKSLGVKHGDRVTIYMPMVPEAAMAMLACTRIGAVHSVVFGGFSPDALRGRIEDCGSVLTVTADEGLRGGKRVPLKANVDKALDALNDGAQRVLVLRHTGADVAWNEARDRDWHELVDAANGFCPAEVMDAEDPLFVLYTSGSTGKPKGILHTTAGYLLYAALTHKYVFDYHDGEVYWCTADVGWITGHSYIVYGPLANGATTLMFEGVPNYPDYSRFWQIVDKHKVNIFYTAPTAVRALMREGDEWLNTSTRKSLRILGSVGEPINPEAWWWYYNAVGQQSCPVMDTWWQTETGGILIAPIAGVHSQKPGSASRPFFGIRPEITTPEGEVLEGKAEGLLCIADSWPGQARSIWGNHQRFIETYFSTVKGKYFTGDGARRDEDGDYWITGRVDDVLNVSGHRLGTAEIESALVAHEAVAEAAVVGMPHDIKGQGIYAYVILNEGVEESDELRKTLITAVRKDIGPIATPDVIHFTPALPKTRSGKIMRRILRKIAVGEKDGFGDTSTLLNPEIVDALLAQYAANR